MLLTSLLPGVREIRAALTAGFLWMLVIWLAIHNSVPPMDDADGIYATLYDFSAVLEGAALGVAASFCAYLLGTLSLALLIGGFPGGRLWSPRIWMMSRRGLVPETVARQPSVRAPFGRRGHRMLTAAGAEAVDDLHGVICALAEVERDQSEQPNPADGGVAEHLALLRVRQLDLQRYRKLSTQTESTALDLALSRTPEMYDVFVAAAVRYHDLGDEPGEVRLRSVRRQHTTVIVDNPARHVLEEEIASRIVKDFDLMRTRLLRPETRELSAGIDRLRSEAELRAAVAPPLLALVVVVAVQTDQLAWLCLVVGIAVLAMEAVRRRRDAGDMLLDALGDRVKSPTLERLSTEAAGICAERLRQ